MAVLITDAAAEAEVDLGQVGRCLGNEVVAPRTETGERRPTCQSSKMGAMVNTWISPKAMKGTPSEIAGRGLVAVEAISKSEVVAVKGGHIVTGEQLRSLPERLQNSDVQITDDLHLVALTEDEYESVMLFINHSCEPNVNFAGNVVLVAMRDIDAGEELTTDYAMFDDYEGSMDCTCGRPACRRRVHGRDWQRPDLQERYRGYFSWYLDRKMQNDGFSGSAS